jgi:hypothetical protein
LAAGVDASEARDASFAVDSNVPPPVTVVSENVVGPYETVTLHATQGDSLETWLTTNGFLIPDAMRPVLIAYTNEGFDFIALKLRPGQGVQAMQPVRVITQGADPTLPLRMVAGGVGAQVGITLFVISEGRYHPQNFPDATIDFAQLEWNPITNRSNYAELANAALAAGDARGWLTESAGVVQTQRYVGGIGLADLYFATCKPTSIPSCSLLDAGAPPLDGGASDAALDAGDADASNVDASGNGDASPSTDGGGACSQTLPCDDIDVATVGMHQGSVWVTRLRSNLSVSALAVDLQIEAAPEQTAVPSQHMAAAYSIPEYDPCAPAGQAHPSSGPTGSSGANGSSGSNGCACEAGNEAKAQRRRSTQAGKLGSLVLAAITASLVGISLRSRRRRGG